MTLSVVNRHETQAVPVRIDIAGGKYTLADGYELSASSMLASNSVARPTEECVHTRQLTAEGEISAREFPPRSITLLVFEKRNTK